MTYKVLRIKYSKPDRYTLYEIRYTPISGGIR